MKEDNTEGLIALLEKKVCVYCLNYIYAGTLVGVNTQVIKLENGGIVYNTGAHDANKFDDYQRYTNSIYINVNAIESIHETIKI